MATPAGGDVSIQMPAATGVSKGRERAAAKLEKRLNRFVRFVAFVEWAGNAFGALAFLWATGVLLGGFCTSLNSTDFWFATVIIFIETFRIFSRGYRLDNESLFGTTGALRWLSSSFSRMLWRPQEGDEVVLFMGLWINLTDHLTGQRLIGPVAATLEVALLILLSRRPRRPQRWQIWALLIACLVAATHQSLRLFNTKEYYSLTLNKLVYLLATLLGYVTTVVAVLLLSFRPRRLSYLTSTPSGRRLVSLAKLVSAVWLASSLVLDMVPITVLNSAVVYAVYLFNTPFTIVVLSLGSLQKPADSLFGHWIDAIVHILFLWDLAFPFPAYFFFFLSAHPSQRVRTVLSFILLLLLLLIGNLQIPAAVVQVVLSSWRLHGLLDHHDYSPLPEGGSENMVPSIEVFYVLTICQGSLYILASILGFFSFFPRRSLVREFKFCGRRGAKAIDVYYQRAYMTCMETGLLASRRTVSLASFAVESLRSNSHRVQLAAVLILDNLLSQETDSSEKLKSRIVSSKKSASKLIGMLRWSDVRDRDIRLFAARATTKLSGNIRIAEIPGMLKLVSPLLDAENQPVRHEDSLLHAQVTADSVTTVGLINAENVVANQSLVQEYLSQTSSHTGENAGSSQPRDGQHGESNNKNRGCSWVRRCWQGMKERWSIPEEPPLTHQDSLPLLGMVILEKLACDPDNCAEMLEATYLISKIIGLISYTTCNKSNNCEKHNAVICSSLHLVRRLASTDGKIGVTARRKLWENPLLLDNLASILEDNRSSPEVWTPTMDIIAKLALDEDARREIGNTQVIIGKLIRAFLGPNDQSLRMAAGEALSNLTMDSTANCSALLEEPGYELVKDLKDMLCEDEYKIYIYMTVSLLQNLCAHSRDKLMSHPGAREHLRSALPAVMENIVSAEGKQLETLIGLASQICSIPECFVFDLDSQTDVAGLIKKLVSTLNSNRKPSPEYPRMRRVIVEMVIFLARSYPRYRTMLREEGVMEALSKAARTPSKVEKYRVFSGDEGVVAEHGIPLRDLVERAKELIGSATPAPGTQPGEHA